MEGGKIAPSTLEVYKNYIVIPYISNCTKTSFVFKNKLQSHFLQLNMLKSSTQKKKKKKMLKPLKNVIENHMKLFFPV